MEMSVNEYAGQGGFKKQTANTFWSMRFEECRPRLSTTVGSLRVSTHGRSFFSRTCQPSELKRKESSASREETIYLLHVKITKL